MRRSLAMSLLRTILRDLRSPYAAYFAATLVFSATSFMLPQFFLLFTENAATISEVSIADFLPRFLAIGLAIAAGLALATFASIFLREWFQLKVERYLRTKVLRSLHQMSIVEIDQVQRGNWLTSVTNDLRNVERFLAESLPKQLRSALILVGTAGVFIFYSRSMAAVPIVACVLIAAVNVWVQRRIAPLLDEIRSLHGGVVQSLLQSLEGIKTVRSYGAEADQASRFSAQLATVEQKGRRVARAFGGLLGSNDAATQILTTLSLAFIMLTLSKGEMTLAAALAYPFYLNLFYTSAETLAGAALDWNEFIISGGRFAEITRETSPVKDQPDRLHASFVASIERVALTNVSFGFSSERTLKEAYDFAVQRNEIVAILGPSGIGKSTFLEVLSGLRPPFAGHWRLHSATGGEDSSFAHEPLPHGLTAYVEQKPYIFEGSMLENLLLGEERSDEDVWDALHAVNLKSFVEENGGLDFFLRDGGQNLSEGQRYRLALARALLRKRPFLLLDEPFAALDHINVGFVVQALHRSKRHCGIVVVTHVIPDALEPNRVIDFAHSASSMSKAVPQVDVTRELSNMNLF